MAAGTGGHVFPALAIAEVMRARNIEVAWLGTHQGMENRILKDKKMPLHRISVKGLRGGSLGRILSAPFMLLKAFVESYKVLGKVKPDFVLGMGGFVCGPAGLACKFRGIPLYIHEQNAVAGLTNKLLAPLSEKVFEGFPQTFSGRKNALFVGNPLRSVIADPGGARVSPEPGQRPFRLLILGGSQGALAINKVIPELIQQMQGTVAMETLHQVGEDKLDETREFYQACKIQLNDSHRLQAFIDDMASAYAWADLVVCRSGASTVSEIAAVGLAAIFIPYPYHKDQQQKLNARWLANENAAMIIEQKDLDVATLREQVEKLIQEPVLIQQMGEKAKSLAVLDAGERITEVCLEALHVA